MELDSPLTAAHNLDRQATTAFAPLVQNPPKHTQAYDIAVDAYRYREASSLRGDALQYHRWNRALSDTLDQHRPGGVRWQAQTPLFGQSLLTVLNTAQYDMLLQCAVHAVNGIAPWRSARHSPLKLPPAMQPPNGDAVINAFIEYVYAYHTNANAMLADDDVMVLPRMPAALLHAGVSEGEMLRFSNLISNNWVAFNMPPVRVHVQNIQPNAQPGDVLIWTSFHGSAAVVGARTPHVTMFDDAVPRGVFDSTTRGALFEIQRTRPIDIGGGLKPTRHEGWNRAYRISLNQTGGLAMLPDGTNRELAEYLAGNDDKEAAALAQYVPVLTPADRAQLQRDGYLIVSAARMDAITAGTWSANVAAVLTQLQDFMNWVLFTQQGAAGQLLFSQPNAPQWAALGGATAEVERYFHDKMLFRTKDRNGNASGTAQGGGTLLAGDSGMGPAANAYDLPAQLALRNSPALYSLMADLYNDKKILMVPERFRVKVAAARLPTHTDVLLQLPVPFN